MSKLLKLLKFLIWCYAAVYLAACLTPYISPLHFRSLTFLALMFPYLLIGMLFTLLLGIFILKKKSILLVIILLLGFKNILSTTGFHTKKEFVQPQKGAIRLLSWNVDDFVDCLKQNDSAHSHLRNIFSFIKTTNPDIICLQDYSDFHSNKYMISSLKLFVDTLKYPYYYFSVDDPCTPDYFPRKYGSIILSRLPIIDSNRVAYKSKHAPEHLMYATIKFQSKELRIYNTHLRSMFLGWQPTNKIIQPFLKDDSLILTDGTKLEKIKYFDSVHIVQADIVKQQLNNCKLPYIFCADLNSVPSSYVYQKISAGLNDAFLQNSFGWGGTYSTMPSTIRIDVVLMSKQLNAVQYYSPKLQNASDHYPVVTDIKIN